MGGGGSQANQSQESLSQADTSVLNAGEAQVVFKPTNVKGGVRYRDISVTNQGVDAAVLMGLAETLTEGATDLGQRIIDSQTKTNESLSDIATVSTGSRSEAGLLVQQLAVPALILAGAVVILPRILK